MKRIQQLEQNIKDKQNELDVVRNEGSVKVAEQLEREIDDLQKQHRVMKGTAAADEEVTTFDELKTAAPDPTLDEQIDYLHRIVKEGSSKYTQAIYKTLLAMKNFRSVGHEVLAELKESRSVPEEVLTRISKPFDLHNQGKFIQGLLVALGTPRNELQTHLREMYIALLASVGQCTWVAQATADWLKRESGDSLNSPSMRALKDGDIEILTRYDDVDNTYIASFMDGDDDQISGTGKTPKEAIDSLFLEKDKKRQGILFPEGGEHD